MSVSFMWRLSPWLPGWFGVRGRRDMKRPGNRLQIRTETRANAMRAMSRPPKGRAHCASTETFRASASRAMTAGVPHERCTRWT